MTGLLESDYGDEVESDNGVDGLARGIVFRLTIFLTLSDSNLVGSAVSRCRSNWRRARRS